ncbi:MAG: DMT family transporter [Alphaproteobacteria bacterium]|nr:DMT family transporter [Alphaproteobacteria bacterium]
MVLKIAPALFVVLWSSAFIGAKFGLPYTEPLTFMSLRFVSVTGIFLFLSVLFNAPWPKSLREAGHIAFVGLLIQALYLSSTFIALDRGASVGVVALILGLQPVLTVLIVSALPSGRVSLKQCLGIILGFGGLILVLWQKLDIGDGDTTALIVVTLGVCFITIGTLYQRRFCSSMDMLSGNVIQAAVAASVTGFGAWVFEDMRVDWDLRFIGALAWMVVVVSLGAHTLLLLMLRQSHATKVASLFYLTPPTAAVMAYYLFDERLTILALAGMTVTVFGVALVVREK